MLGNGVSMLLGPALVNYSPTDNNSTGNNNSSSPLLFGMNSLPLKHDLTQSNQKSLSSGLGTHQTAAEQKSKRQ